MDSRSMEIDEDEVDFEYEQGDDDDGSEDDEFDDDDDYEIKFPKVSNWIDSDGTTIIHGVEVINDDDDDINNKLSNRCGFDVCSICLKAWNSHGKHRICCLPCGHLYGMSCIKRWLLQHETSRKCPQCNTPCTFKDVRLLYATRLCLSHHKEPSTTRFPFTVKGFYAFQTYLLPRWDDAVRLQEDVSRRKDDVFTQLTALSKKLAHLSKQRDYTLARASIALENRDALERRANALGRQVYALERRCDSLDRRAKAFERRWHALGKLADSYRRSRSFVMQQYKEHKIKADKNNTNTKH